MTKPNSPPLPQPRRPKVETQAYDPVYVYHWDRILIAGALLLLFLGFIVYGLYAWLKRDASEHEYARVSVHSKVESGISDAQTPLAGEQIESPAAPPIAPP
jgi:hypothetical protein